MSSARGVSTFVVKVTSISVPLKCLLVSRGAAELFLRPALFTGSCLGHII